MKIASLVDRLEENIKIDGHPHEIVTATAFVLASEGMAPLTAIEEADRLKSAVAHEVSRRFIKREAEGLIPIIELCDTFSSRIRGSAFSGLHDNEKTRKSKLGRKNISRIKDKIVSLTPQEFELFGARLVASLGASVHERTKQSGDQGLDFVGSARLGDLLDHPKQILKLTHDMSIDFVGQAKHYPNRTLQSSTVRELVGSLQLARSRHFSSEKFSLIEDISLKSFSPVFAIIITTGKVSRGARLVADKSGIVIKSGEQLAAYLADLGVGICNDSGDFDDSVFDSWLNT